MSKEKPFITRTSAWILVALFAIVAPILGVVAGQAAWQTSTKYAPKAGGVKVTEYVTNLTMSTVAGVAAIDTTTMHGRITGAWTYATITSAPPSAAWDCEILYRGADVMGGAMADRLQTTAQFAVPLYKNTINSTDWTYVPIEPRVDGTVAVSCTNMGTTKRGTVVIQVVEDTSP